MSDIQEPTAESPTARKRGRPRKTDTGASTSNTGIMNLLAKQVQSLQEQLAAMTVERASAIDHALPDAPAADDKNRPGTYAVIGHDAKGDPVFKKRRWTRAQIIKEYPPVTFTPMHTIPVSPHGVRWDLVAGQETTVPCIVKEIYTTVFLPSQPVNLARRFPEPTESQNRELIRIAKEQGRSVSGLVFLGTGFPQQTQPEEPEKQPA